MAEPGVKVFLVEVSARISAEYEIEANTEHEAMGEAQYRFAQAEDLWATDVDVDRVEELEPEDESRA